MSEARLFPILGRRTWILECEYLQNDIMRVRRLTNSVTAARSTKRQKKLFEYRYDSVFDAYCGFLFLSLNRSCGMGA